jgi:lambda repressor-like predicted transcriptional regulator
MNAFKDFSAKPLADYFRNKPYGIKAQAARAMGVKPNVLSNWLSKKRIPGNKLIIVAHFLGMSPNEYLEAAGVIPKHTSKADGYSLAVDRLRRAIVLIHEACDELSKNEVRHLMHRLGEPAEAKNS